MTKKHKIKFSFNLTILIFAIILLSGLLIYAGYSNIFSFKARSYGLGTFVVQTSCQDYNIADEMLRKFGPDNMAEFTLACSLRGGDLFEGKNISVCSFRQLRNVEETCEWDLIQEMGNYCETALKADWVCTKSQVGCWCKEVNE